MKKTLIVATTLGLTFALPQAEATLFNFSYISSGGTLVGILDGVAQLDGNTVLVNSIQDFATFNGTPFSSLSVVYSPDAFAGINLSALPKVTFDGSLMDIVGSPSIGLGSFRFAVNDSASLLVGGVDTFTVYPPQGSGTPEVFVAANWSLTPFVASAVPVPATLALFAIGGAALAARHRKAA